MRDERGRIELAVLDHLQQLPAIFLDRRLAALNGEPLLHQLSQREFVSEAPIDTGNRNTSALAARKDSLPQRMRSLGNRIHLDFDLIEYVVRGEAVAFHADAVDARVGPDPSGHLIKRLANVDLRVVKDLGAELLCKPQARGEMIDRDHASGA